MHRPVQSSSATTRAVCSDATGSAVCSTSTTDKLHERVSAPYREQKGLVAATGTEVVGHGRSYVTSLLCCLIQQLFPQQAVTRSSQCGGRGLRFIARASSTPSCWRRTRRCSRRSRSSLTQRQRPARRLRLTAVGPHDAQNAVWCLGSTQDRRCAVAMPRVWVRPLRPSTSADGRLADLIPPDRVHPPFVQL